MAVTKTHPIKSTLKAAIDYILNPEKTDGKLLASSFGCGLETADIEFAWTREAAGDRGTHAIAAEQPQRDNPLKHVEDTIEQNDNNFDGLINNTPQTPTVADFEQRAKAGEAISVTDLAKAVKAEKREQPQKKPSILKKLDEYKKQAAQQPKDKQKEHKKDLEV